MESTFKADQDDLLNRLAQGVTAQKFSLQNGDEIVVHQGQVIVTAKPRTRPDLAYIKVESLTSLAQLAIGLNEIESADDSLPKMAIQVYSPHAVKVLDLSEPEKHQCVVQAIAALPDLSVLREFVPLEVALIQLREGFQPGQGVESLSEQFSSVRIEDLTELRDDGVSMAVGAKTRIVSEKRGSEAATVFNLELSPLRTFPEVEVVPSIFTMRWKRSGNTVLVRLIEQQQGAWRLKQMQVIQKFLQNLLPEALILV